MHIRFPWHLLAAVATGLVVAACGVAPTVERDAKAEHFPYQGGEVAARNAARTANSRCAAP